MSRQGKYACYIAQSPIEYHRTIYKRHVLVAALGHVVEVGTFTINVHIWRDLVNFTDHLGVVRYCFL